MLTRIKVVSGDIAELKLDAIVTAANEALAGGHGVDGAVHRAAGPELFAECQTLRYCAEGDAKITKGYNLPAKHVIHTVGPVWEGGTHGEEELLSSCYRRCLELAGSHNIESMAFPCIATGAHDYPPELACEIAVREVSNWMDSNALPRSVTFCCYEQSDYELYSAQLRQA